MIKAARYLFRVGLWAVLMVVAGPVLAKELDVAGYGFLDNLKLENLLEEISREDEDFYSPFFVEEAFFLLNSRLQKDGFLNPTLSARLTMADGSVETITWEGTGRRPLREDARIERAEFQIEPGVGYYFESLTFSGVHMLETEELRSYFFPTGLLFGRKTQRVFSPERLQGGVRNVVARLKGLGFRDAEAVAEIKTIDDETGAVSVHVEVTEGPIYLISAVVEDLAPDVDSSPHTASLLQEPRDLDVPFTTEIEQDLILDLRNRFYRAGYPDVDVASEVRTEMELEGDVIVNLWLFAKPGPRVRLVDVEFRGDEQTQESLLRSKAGLEVGDWLNRLEVEEARYRIGRLGVFEEVDLSIVPGELENSRRVLFDLEEGAMREASLRVGYGSYEKLRFGAEFTHFNLWGLAHHWNVRGLISFKTLAIETNYNIPLLFNLPLSNNSRIRYLEREEVSFTREEYVVESGVNLDVEDWNSNFGASYSLELLKARNIRSEQIEIPDDTRVGALTLTYQFDDRGNIINPDQGFTTGFELELSAQPLGSEVDYQRLIWGTSWHNEVDDGRWVHLSFEHEALFSLGTEEFELPLNKRFFPGGQNSIRGYQEGAASPRDADGTYIGAAVTSLLTAEFEQLLTSNLRAVFFVDALLQSETIDDYPGSTDLYSVGAGLRYLTPLGPLRVEYGYNVDPREGDPEGTLHIGLGYPF